MKTVWIALVALAAAACSTRSGEAEAHGASAAVEPALAPIAIPHGEGGVGFDELRYSPRLGRVLVPAGGTGQLVLVDPATGALETVAGFGHAARYSGGHGDGTTSCDEGPACLFAIDRTAKVLAVVDPVAKRISSTVALAGAPDYVRYVAATNEVWVTEPDSDQLEIFSLSDAQPPVATHTAFVRTPGGPESLVIDTQRGRAYTHQWEGMTLAIDVAQRTIVGRWPNGCGGSRGIALDVARGLLFVACAEGVAAVLDVKSDGRVLSKTDTGSGVDIVDYDATLGHFYLPSASDASLAIFGVSTAGELALLGKLQTTKHSSCVVTDGAGRLFVGDPAAGRVLALRDTYPASR